MGRQCGAVWPTCAGAVFCVRDSGHEGDHRGSRVQWTQAGERVRITTDEKGNPAPHLESGGRLTRLTAAQFALLKRATDDPHGRVAIGCDSAALARVANNLEARGLGTVRWLDNERYFVQKAAEDLAPEGLTDATGCDV